MARTDPRALQFGDRPIPGDFAERPTAFGVLERGGRIAVVRITNSQEPPYLDLPGGAVDPGETEAEAMIREFGEETGLKIAAGALIERAAQFIWKPDGRTANNLCAFYAADLVAEAPGLKVEHDHALEWLDPVEAVKGLHHEAHAWAVVVWMRRPR